MLYFLSTHRAYIDINYKRIRFNTKNKEEAINWLHNKRVELHGEFYNAGS